MSWLLVYHLLGHEKVIQHYKSVADCKHYAVVLEQHYHVTSLLSRQPPFTCRPSKLQNLF